MPVPGKLLPRFRHHLAARLYTGGTERLRELLSENSFAKKTNITKQTITEEDEIKEIRTRDVPCMFEKLRGA